MIKLLFIILFFCVGCSSTQKQVNIIPKTQTPKEVAEELSSKHTEEDLPLVEIEKPDNIAGQNGELQTWLESGNSAPYSGILLNPEAMAFIISEYEAQIERAQAAVKKQRDIDLAKLNLEVSKVIVELKANKKQNMVLIKGKDEEIDRLRKMYEEVLKESKKPWKKILIGASSFIVGAGAGIIIVNLTTN